MPKTEIKTVSVQSTSYHSASCSDIVIRDGEQVRLLFRPAIVNNPSHPAACVRGRFLYQRKGKHDQWEDFDSKPLSSIKKGEQFQLEIHSGELLPFLHELAGFYRLHSREGIPQGKVEFLRVEGNMARLLQLSEAELNDFLSANRDDALTILRRVLKWLASRSPEAVFQGDELAELNALAGLANLRTILNLWTEHCQEDDEGFWQKLLSTHSLVLSQLFAYPVVVIKEKAYVGGKRIDNRHGNVADFLCQIRSSKAAVLIEIKTPMTPLLERAYRQDVFPPTREVVGAISQVLAYRESLMNDLHTLTSEQSVEITATEPRCIVIAGSADHELLDDARKRSFERFRERLIGVTVVTFDEVFERIRNLIRLFEVSGDADSPQSADDWEVDFE
jgi:hypothetical protein